MTVDRATSALLVIDVQARLMPAIEGAAALVANVRRLLDAASLLGVPAAFTEQNPAGLGPTLQALQPARPVLHKMAFDACRDGGLASMPDRPAMVVAGCEAHVCVLQTVLGLLAAGRQVFVVRDALGSRRAESKDTAIARMARHGAEIVTAEMVIFEWLGTADDPRFRQAVALVK
jgi:nicotinamidase-related amidase